jgi:hypothetical protein
MSSSSEFKVVTEKTVLEEYLENPVFYNEKYNKMIGDEDGDGKMCLDLGQTMRYLFIKDEIKYDSLTSERNTSFVVYDLQGPKQVHEVILFNRVLYEMVDGQLYTNSLIFTDEYIEQHSSQLCSVKVNGVREREKLKIIEKTYFTVKTEEESRKMLETLQ